MSASADTMEDLKLVMVGDPAMGKTHLLMTYTMEKYIEPFHIPTVFGDYSSSEMFGDREVNLNIFDTSGAEDYDRLRPLSYPGTNICLICFSVDNRISLENISPKWYPEIRHHCPDTPILLVATKIDLRDESPSSVTTEEGEQLAREIGALGYVETSALKMEGVKECFQKAVEVALTKREPKKKKKGILSRLGISKTNKKA